MKLVKKLNCLNDFICYYLDVFCAHLFLFAVSGFVLVKSFCKKKV